VLFINPDFRYNQLPEDIKIEPRDWNRFINLVIEEAVTMGVKYERPKSTQNTEEFIAQFIADNVRGLSNDDLISNKMSRIHFTLDAIQEEIRELVETTVVKHDGYTELNVVKHPHGWTIASLGDHRILEWHKGHGSPTPTAYLNETRQAAKFNAALTASAFGRVVVHQTIELTTKPRPKPAPVNVYISHPTAFVDGENMGEVTRTGCEVRTAEVSDNVYEVIPEGLEELQMIFGNWDGAGDVFCPVDIGSTFSINKCPKTGRPKLRFL
jgi:hypothetical protein